MTRTSIRIVLLVVVLSAIPAHAKAPTLQISIAGPDLEEPLHSSADMLIAPNVWLGNFIDWKSGPIKYQAKEYEMYRIHFWTKSTPGGTRMIYVVFFSWSAKLGHGVVCLPGERTKWHGLNQSTIIRGDFDGSCFYADDEWGAALKKAIENGQ